MTDTASADGSLPDAPPLSEKDPKPVKGYRSYKRKYAKYKIRFEQAMGNCSVLFKEDQRLRDLSRRLKEQNE